jgi:hypothetical protein
VIKTALAAIGLYVSALWVLGVLDIGHFRMYYGKDPHGCAKMEVRP